MKIFTRKVFAAALTSAAISVACSAAWAGPPAMMDMLDRSNDGLIGFEEFSAVPLKHFQRVDTNHDGIISAAEHEAAHPERTKRLRQTAPESVHRPLPGPPDADADGDGQISYPELENSLRTRFSAIDANQNGVIEEAESTKADTEMPPPPEFRAVRN